MRELIEGQTIKFDNHRRGDGQAAVVQGLHMHKRMNGKNFKGVDAIFPLTGKGDIEFRPKSFADDRRRQLMNEVQSVLKKDPARQRELVQAVVDETERFSGSLPKPEQINAIRRGAERIAGFFSDKQFNMEVSREVADGRIRSIITKHRKQKHGFFYVEQDYLDHTVTVSDKRSELH